MVAQLTDTPTPSVLFYLHADRVIAPAKGFKGIKLPGKDTRVSYVDLAATLFAAAFWNLREQGLLQLNVAKGKVLFIFPAARVNITLLQRSERPGLEGELLAHVNDAGDNVYDVVKRWYGHDIPNPYRTIISHVEAEAVVAGYLNAVAVDAPHGQPSASISGEATLEPDAAALATAAAPFAECAARWEAFKTTEAALYTTLIKTCKHALYARRENYDDGDSSVDPIF